MIDFLTYDLKVAVLIIVFYMFYRLLLSHETFHRVNRVMLLLTAVASFVLPLCVITIHKTVMLKAMPEIAIGEVQMEVETESSTPYWQMILPILYAIGLLATLGHTLLSIWKVILLIRRSERHPQPDGNTICVIENARVAPFSWMRYIVMNCGDYEVQDATILAHERGHIRLRHSWDILLVDLLTAFQWFNPAMWLLRQDLRAIHEYEADGEVLSQGINARQYQYLLISKATGIGGYSIANGINHSTLKKRIYMMTNMKSKSNHLLKLLALVPIVGITLALNARTVTDYVYDEPQKQQPVKKAKKAGALKVGSKTIELVEQSMPHMQVKTDEKVYDVVDQMPEFPGGPGAMLQYLGQTIRYPQEAFVNNVQGRVIVNFVVEKDGTINDAKVVRSIDPQLDEEALRVVNSMPNWTPGQQNGEPVAVKYTIPITFKLSGGEDTKSIVDDKDNVQVEIDGEKAEMIHTVLSQIEQELDPADIESISVDKSDPNVRLVKIVTKKKQ